MLIQLYNTYRRWSMCCSLSIIAIPVLIQLYNTYRRWSMCCSLSIIAIPVLIQLYNTYRRWSTCCGLSIIAIPVLIHLYNTYRRWSTCCGLSIIAIPVLIHLTILTDVGPRVVVWAFYTCADTSVQYLQTLCNVLRFRHSLPILQHLSDYLAFQIWIWRAS